MVHLDALLNGGRDAEHVDPALLIRIRAVNAGMLTMMAIGVPFIVQYWSLGLSHMVAWLVVTIAAAGANMLWLRRGGDPVWAGYVACGLMFALLIASNVTSGGFYQPNFGWLYVVPLAGALLANVRATIVLTLLIVAAAVVFWVMPQLGIELVNMVPADEQAGQALANRLSAIVAVGILTWLFARQQRRAEAQLSQLAYVDSLTGLPNRHSFQIELNQQLDASDDLALLFIDLDRFKDVNDALGHSVGDELLGHVADRFVRCLRPSDALTHSVSRLGGDEFTVLLHDVRDREAAAIVAQRLLDSLREPIAMQSQSFYVNASIGVAVAPEDGKNAEELLKNADAAMFAVKRRGGGFGFFENAMGEQHSRRLMIGGRLREAIQRDELDLVYQPIVDADSGRVCRVEALARWTVDGESISPAEFVPIAEATGSAAALDAWVFRRATAEFASWELPDIKLALNVSGKHLSRGGVVGSLLDALKASGLSHDRVEIEITESAIVEAGSDALKKLPPGIGIALDDFGTGFSSLAHLRRFPVTTLKIDRSFVSAIDDPDSAKLCEAVIALGKSFDVAVVAEGVETQEQADALRALGCTILQGYLYARPLAAESVASFVRHPLAG